ncbi:hypothetical protein VIGAN_01338200, partial [Vigna angularis var. angularis]
LSLSLSLFLSLCCRSVVCRLFLSLSLLYFLFVALCSECFCNRLVENERWKLHTIYKIENGGFGGTHISVSNKTQCLGCV